MQYARQVRFNNFGAKHHRKPLTLSVKQGSCSCGKLETPLNNVPKLVLAVGTTFSYSFCPGMPEYPTPFAFKDCGVIL